MGPIISAITLVRSPKAYVTAHKDDSVSIGDIMIRYVAVLAAIPSFAFLIGFYWYSSITSYNTTFVNDYNYSATDFIFITAVLAYILFIVAVCVLGVAFRLLAPKFNSSAEGAKPFKLAAYVYTPIFLVSILDIIPIGYAYLGVLGLPYGLYILYRGLPTLLGTPKEKALSYVIVAAIAAVVVFVLINEATFGFFTTGPV